MSTRSADELHEPYEPVDLKVHRYDVHRYDVHRYDVRRYFFLVLPAFAGAALAVLAALAAAGFSENSF